MKTVIIHTEDNELGAIAPHFTASYFTPDRRFFYASEGQSALEVVLHPDDNSIQVGFFQEGETENTYIAGSIKRVAIHDASYSESSYFPSIRLPKPDSWDFHKAWTNAVNAITSPQYPIRGMQDWIKETLLANTEYIYEKIQTHNKPFYSFAKDVRKYRNARDVFEKTLSRFPDHMLLALLQAEVDRRFVVFRKIYLAVSEEGYPYYVSLHKQSLDRYHAVDIQTPPGNYLTSIMASTSENHLVPKSMPSIVLAPPAIVKPKPLFVGKASPTADVTMHFVKTDELNPAFFFYYIRRESRPSIWFVEGVQIDWKVFPISTYYKYRKGLPFFLREDIPNLIPFSNR